MKEIRELTKQYGERVLFRNLSRRFPEKGCVLITGASGSGKTTLLRILCGLEREYAGSVAGFDGRCAVAFQEYRLFPRLSALANVAEVAFGRRPTAEETARAKELLKDFGFSDEDMKKKPEELSGGMKQRVNIARAIAARKEVLLLDEPVKELNGELAESIRKRIAKEAGERLVILVSHSEKDRDLFGENILHIGE